MFLAPQPQLSRQERLESFESIFSSKIGIEEESIGVLEVVKVESFPDIGLARVTVEQSDGEHFIRGIALLKDGIEVGSKVKTFTIGLERNTPFNPRVFKPVLNK